MRGNIESEIRSEIYRAFRSLGADSGLLAIIGSWGDTLDDTAILKLLKQWNNDRSAVEGDR